MNKSSITLILLIIIFTSTNFLIAQLTPQEAVPQIMKGINIGNTLEPPNEGGWNNGPVKEYYFDDYKSAGFDIVRIPVRWDEHTQIDSPYTITDEWLNRVEQIVDWGLERDLFVIINAHHEEWIKANYSDSNKARFDSIWSQISYRFKDKSEKLFFEIINEPKGLTVAQVDDLNARILSIIRITNPTRIVIYSGNEWSGIDPMIKAKVLDDQYIMAYYHSYDPYTFALLGNGTFGSQTDLNLIKNIFEKGANWSTTNNVPVMISEFGAMQKCDYNSRMLHYATYVEQAILTQTPFMVWDDGGDFRMYDRNNRTWPEETDILFHYSIHGPNKLKYNLEADSLITISWNNRSSEYLSNTIERKVNSGAFEIYAELEGSTEIFSDTNLSVNNNYYYRVISKINDTTSYYSYPINVLVKSTKRTSYLGTPFTIPGVIEAEYYDVGGEGLTYHDTDESNIPGGIRTEEGVDIEIRDSGGCQISYIETGEWVEYTIDVEQDGEYYIIADVASLEGGGMINFSVGNEDSGVINIPSTNSWQTTTTVTDKISLKQGIQILKLSMVLANPFNVDKFELTLTPTDISEENPLENKFALYPNYPNPFNPTTIIKYSVAANEIKNNKFVQIKVFDILGKEVADLVKQNQRPGNYEITFDASNLTSGIYYYQLVSGDFVSTKKMLLLK